MARLWRRVRAGTLPKSRIADFVDATWPTNPQLEAIVSEIACAGEIALHGAAAQMVKQISADEPEGALT